MKQDEIIEMARQAGFSSWDEGELQSPFVEGADLSSMLEAFAKLVAAKEREECAKWFESIGLQSEAHAVRTRDEA